MATYVNLTCATAADCSSHSDRLVCTAHGVCGCPWREQLTSSDPEGGRWCDAMTMSSGWSVGVRSLNVLLFGAVLSYASVLLLRHVRAEGRRASYTLLTLCWLLRGGEAEKCNHRRRPEKSFTRRVHSVGSGAALNPADCIERYPFNFFYDATPHTTGLGWLADGDSCSPG